MEAGGYLKLKRQSGQLSDQRVYAVASIIRHAALNTTGDFAALDGQAFYDAMLDLGHNRRPAFRADARRQLCAQVSRFAAAQAQADGTVERWWFRTLQHCPTRDRGSRKKG